MIIIDYHNFQELIILSFISTHYPPTPAPKKKKSKSHLSTWPFYFKSTCFTLYPTLKWNRRNSANNARIHIVCQKYWTYKHYRSISHIGIIYGYLILMTKQPFNTTNSPWDKGWEGQKHWSCNSPVTLWWCINPKVTQCHGWHCPSELNSTQLIHLISVYLTTSLCKNADPQNSKL